MLLVHWRFEFGGIDEFGSAGMCVSDIVGRSMHVSRIYLDIVSATCLCNVGSSFVLKITDGRSLRMLYVEERYEIDSSIGQTFTGAPDLTEWSSTRDLLLNTCHRPSYRTKPSCRHDDLLNRLLLLGRDD